MKRSRTIAGNLCELGGEGKEEGRPRAKQTRTATLPRQSAEESNSPQASAADAQPTATIPTEAAYPGTVSIDSEDGKYYNIFPPPASSPSDTTEVLELDKRIAALKLAPSS